MFFLTLCNQVLCEADSKEDQKHINACVNKVSKGEDKFDTQDGKKGVRRTHKKKDRKMNIKCRTYYDV